MKNKLSTLKELEEIEKKYDPQLSFREVGKKFNIIIFIIVSLISRGLRFFIVSYLSYKFGNLFTEFMDKHGSKWFTIIGLLIVITGVIIYLIFKYYV